MVRRVVLIVLQVEWNVEIEGMYVPRNILVLVETHTGNLKKELKEGFTSLLVHFLIFEMEISDVHYLSQARDTVHGMSQAFMYVEIQVCK